MERKLDITEDDLALVNWTIKKYYKQYSHDEDMFQEACLAMVNAAAKLGGSFRGNTQYVVSAIRYAIIREWEKRESERINRHTNWRETECSENWVESVPSPPVYPVELVLPDWMDEREKIVVTMRNAGYTNKEISKVIGTSRQTVSRIKSGLQLKCLKHGLVTKEEYNERTKSTNRVGRTYNRGA